MTKALKTKIMCYLTSIVVCAYLVYSYCASRDIGNLELVDQYHILCDAFFLRIAALGVRLHEYGTDKTGWRREITRQPDGAGASAVRREGD